MGRFSKYLLVIASLCAVALATPTANAGTPCVEAVFFDLGNTLVEDPGGGTFVLRPGAAETISGLQDRGVRLGIITNVPGSWDIDDLRALLADPDFLDEFEVVILSSEAPASKPDPAIYLFAHEALAEPRPAITSTAFVGETLIEIANAEFEPTLGARSVGMVGIHLSDGAPSPLSDYTIPTDGLEEVITIVEDTCDPTDIEDPAEPSATPTTGSSFLHAPRPNPSDGNTAIVFSVSVEERVTIGIYDAQGRHITSLVDEVISPGRHELSWNGTNSLGDVVSRGIYYSRMEAGGELHQEKILKLE